MEQHVPGASAPPSLPADTTQAPVNPAPVEKPVSEATNETNPEQGNQEQKRERDSIPPWMRRQVSKARDRAVAAETRAQLLEQRLAQIESRLTGGESADSGNGPATRQQQEIDPVEIRAQVEERVAFDLKCNDTFDKGAKEFGKAFESNLETLKEVGINERALRVIVDSDAPHKVLNYLGENPETAEEIFALPPVQMARALGRIEAALNPPAPPKPPKASSAPDPVRPVDAKAGGTSAPSDKDDISTWMAKRNAQLSGGGR